MRPRAHSVRDWMARLARIPGLLDSGSDEPVELGKLRTRTEVLDGLVVDREQLVEQLVVTWLELSGADVLRVVAPVAVGADPDLEQGRLVLLDRAIARGREGADARARPDEREAEREVDVAASRTLAMHVAQPQRGRLALRHAWAEIRLHVLHRRRGDLVRDPHPLELLRRLDRPCLVQQRRGVRSSGPSIEPCLRIGRGLADHPVRSLRPERELQAHARVLARSLEREIERAHRRRPRVGRVVPREEPNVLGPRAMRDVVRRRLERDQRRLPRPRKDHGFVALHAPEVRQVEDVVGSPDDQRVELLLGHQRPDALELRVVPLPRHQRTRSGAGSPWASCQETTGFRSTPILSISASITSPGFR